MARYDSFGDAVLTTLKFHQHSHQDNESLALHTYRELKALIACGLVESFRLDSGDLEFRLTDAGEEQVDRLWRSFGDGDQGNPYELPGPPLADIQRENGERRLRELVGRTIFPAR